MNTEQVLALIGMVYLAPHMDKRVSLVVGIACVLIAVLLKAGVLK